MGTLFDTSDAAHAALKQLAGEVNYVVFQKEKCPTTGKEHFQWALWTREKIRFSTLRNKLAAFKPYVKQVKGSNTEKAQQYCMKEESRLAGPWQYGTAPTWLEKRTKTQFKDLLTRMMTGESQASLWENQPNEMARHHRALGAAAAALVPVRQASNDVHVHYLWGPTGVGKTRHVMETYGAEVYAWEPGKWWPNIMPTQKILLIDDLDKDSARAVGARKWKRILDRYPVQEESKGGFQQVPFTTIYITSNWAPEEVFGQFPQQDYDAIMRRIEEIRFMEPV